MKATINGITVEGTPEEIWNIIQRNKAQAAVQYKPYQNLDWAYEAMFPNGINVVKIVSGSGQ